MARHASSPTAILLLISLALVLAGCSADGSPADDGIEVLELTQGRHGTGDHPLQVEWSAEPRVLDLRTQERLDAVVAGSGGEMETFKRLTAWTRAQFEPGDPDPYPLPNGLSVLHDIRSGRTGGSSGQYSYLLADALKSFGHFAVRYVELESETGAGHFAVEAWSNELARWVLLDPSNAVLYLRDGIPLSALELHDELLAGRSAGIQIDRLALPASRRGPGIPAGDAATPPRRIEAPAADLLAVFYNVAVSIRNDFARLDHPLTIAERERVFLRYADPRIAPFRHLDFAIATSRREEILVPMNQVGIELQTEPEKNLVHLSFSTGGSCPHFSNYRVHIGGRPWANTGAQLAWSLARGENTLEVRTVNAFEVLGPIFRVRVKI